VCQLYISIEVSEYWAWQFIVVANNILFCAAKKAKKKKQVLSLGEFLGDEAGNVVTTTSSWAEEVEQQADGLCQLMTFVTSSNETLLHLMIA